MYAVDLDHTSGELRLSELSALITSNALITVRKDRAFDIESVVARWDDQPDLVEFRVGFLLYGLIDHVVDGHFAAVQDLDDEIEQLEDLLFDQRTGDEELQRRCFALRKSLVILRRVVLPMREVVNGLMRRDLHIVTGDMARVTRTSMTTSCARQSGPSPCATWSPPSSRPTSLCRATGST